MFSWAFVFFLIALIACMLGFFEVAPSAMGVAEIVSLVALVMTILGFAMGRRPPDVA